MFASHIRLAPSSIIRCCRPPLSIYGLLCLITIAFVFIIMRTYDMLIDSDDDSTLAITIRDIPNLNSFNIDTISNYASNNTDQAKNFKKLTNKLLEGTQPLLLSLRDIHLQQVPTNNADLHRERRQVPYWPSWTLPSTVRPTPKINIKSRANATRNHTFFSETLNNVYSTLTSLVGAKTNNQQVPARNDSRSVSNREKHTVLAKTNEKQYLNPMRPLRESRKMVALERQLINEGAKETSAKQSSANSHVVVAQPPSKTTGIIYPQDQTLARRSATIRQFSRPLSPIHGLNYENSRIARTRIDRFEKRLMNQQPNQTFLGNNQEAPIIDPNRQVQNRASRQMVDSVNGMQDGQQSSASATTSKSAPNVSVSDNTIFGNNMSDSNHNQHLVMEIQLLGFNEQRQDPLQPSQSGYSYTRTSVSIRPSNHDNRQWRPIPDDYNGPLLPVQLDLLDGVYTPGGGGRNFRDLYGKRKKNPINRHYNNNNNNNNHNNNLDQQPTVTHKIYRKVLVNDKTLVSLDFAHNFKSEPGPDIDSNMIDFEALNIINNDKNIAKARYGTSKQPINYKIKAINRDVMFSDSDPLIGCDMWDLEKGLSSRKPPAEIVRIAVQTDFHTMREAIERCRILSEKSLPPSDTDSSIIEISPDDVVSIFSLQRGLMPGTKWCGIGDSATSYNDLGSKKRIDICCRAHDHCPLRLKPIRQGYGLMNLAIYTKSHCECDADFYRCLKSTKTKAADVIGNIYFNVLKLQCLHEEKLKVCVSIKQLPLGFEKCLKWEDSPDKTAFKFIQPPVPY